MTPRPRREQGQLIRASPSHAAGAEGTPLLTPKQRSQLLAIATRVNARKGQILYREGSLASSLYICYEGMVKTYRDLPSGRRRITTFLYSRDVFGLAESGRYVNTAQTVIKTTCYRIPMDVLTAVLQQDAALQYVFLTKVTHELRQSQRRTIMMGRRDAAGRFAMFLMMMRQHGPNRPTSNVILLPMSRSDIAAYLGHSLEAISRATAQLSAQHLITFQGRHAVRVLDMPRLEHLAADV
jgi:CRP-like cAMP-binding protein